MEKMKNTKKAPSRYSFNAAAQIHHLDIKNYNLEKKSSPGGSIKAKNEPEAHFDLSKIGNPRHLKASRQLNEAVNGINTGNTLVYVRVRPPLDHELTQDVDFHPVTFVDSNNRKLRLVKRGDFEDEKVYWYTFDHVFDSLSTQTDVYEKVARPLVMDSLSGYNATVFAYGQTGAGKTYTMEGDCVAFANRGIVPRAVEDIFCHIREAMSKSVAFQVRASYFQIYNDTISDLFHPESDSLQIREDDRSHQNSRGVYLENLREIEVESPQQLFQMMADGASRRTIGRTKMNDMSSRSHAILQLMIEQSETSYVDPESGDMVGIERVNKMLDSMVDSKNPTEAKMVKAKMLEYCTRKRYRVSKLNLVDLAGSERLRDWKTGGSRQEESRKINSSLSALGNTVNALSTPGRTHVPYRDSKLTRILEDSLGGNCRTAFIANISPSDMAVGETLSTLAFANRAKRMTNNATINENIDINSLLKAYEGEIKRLRQQLNRQTEYSVDERVIWDLENQKQRAESEKSEALRALGVRSNQFFAEKRAKKKLEKRIAKWECATSIDQPDEIIYEGKNAGKGFYSSDELEEYFINFQLELKEEYETKLKKLENIFTEEMESLKGVATSENGSTERYWGILHRQKQLLDSFTTKLKLKDQEIAALQKNLEEEETRGDEALAKLDYKALELKKLHTKIRKLELELAKQSAEKKRYCK